MANAPIAKKMQIFVCRGMSGGMVANRYIELITERPTERFLHRLILRGTALRSIQIVSPFISSMADSRHSLAILRKKIDQEEIPTYVITRDPIELYQKEAMAELLGSPWIELRYNTSIHAKVYVALSKREAESFALFGSCNLTSRSICPNIEVAMLVYGVGPGKDILRELSYLASVRLRTLKESRLIQPIQGSKRSKADGFQKLVLP